MGPSLEGPPPKELLKGPKKRERLGRRVSATQAHSLQPLSRRLRTEENDESELEEEAIKCLERERSPNGSISLRSSNFSLRPTSPTVVIIIVVVGSSRAAEYRI